MDERVWWIAQKIQECFEIGGHDNPQILEEFMTEESHLAKVNRFLKQGGPVRLFFYCRRKESGVTSPRELHITGNLATLKDIDIESQKILYFLRNSPDKDVDPSRMERDIFCGELKHNSLETIGSLLSDVYIPLIKAQKEWGYCNDDVQNSIIHGMDKFIGSLQESAASQQSSKQMMLKQPENVILNDFKQQRAAALDSQLIIKYEELVSDWMCTIEAILVDTSDERFMDPNAGPLSELERWRRRQRLITSITEQLKSKECKAVIGVLITAKSRLLKKWKTIDAGITDAMNDTKDKLKYLESLKRHFDQLYNDSSPSSIMNNAIPGLFNGIKQMDSISRFYSRIGFLGLILTKVTNQLVLSCKDYIKAATISLSDVDELWSIITHEIQQKDGFSPADPHHRLLRNQIEAKLKENSAGWKSRKDNGVTSSILSLCKTSHISGLPELLAQGPRGNKTRESKEFGVQDDTLFGRLRACLTLQGFYRESLRSLRESLGTSQNLSHFPSISSVGGPGSFTARSKGASGGSRLTTGTSSPKKGISSVIGDNMGHGVPIADEEAILGHMDNFCSRIRQLLDVMNTLAQYHKLVQSTVGVPKPRKEDFLADDADQDERYKHKKEMRRKSVEFDEVDDDTGDIKMIVPHSGSPDRSLKAIAEDEETPDDTPAVNDVQEVKEDSDPKTGQEDTLETLDADKNKLSEDELTCLRKYYPEDEEIDGPSVSVIIRDHLQHMTEAMSENVTTKTMLDVESKDKDKFEQYYFNFQAIVRDLEQFLGAYLHTIFLRKMKTPQGLDIITRFSHVQNRSGIRIIIAEKFIEIFSWYENDLEEVAKIYEAQKDHPQMVRNAPPVAGAIYWSRQLLKRIEDPMKTFRDNKAITQLGDFGRICRVYNRLATALVTFESLWFTQWKNTIELAKTGLRATLFVHHPVSNEIVVNADERVLELIHEAKWLTRLGVQIPESAMSIMQQESRFKNYKNHLELVLNDYKEVCQSIPEPLKKLFDYHVENVHQQLQPGLSTLAWNSMNIDAFLHQIHSATTKLKQLGVKVKEIMDTKVYGVLDKILNLYLFDYEVIFAQSWEPNEFKDTMLESVKERAEALRNNVTLVVEGLQDVANALATKKEYQLSIVRGIMRTKSIFLKWKNKVVEKNELSGHHRMREKQKLPVIFDDADEKKIKEQAFYEESNVYDLIAYFKEKVVDAVLTATCRSLGTLAEASGCSGEVVRVMSSLSNYSSEASSLSPRTLSRGSSSLGSRVGSAASLKGLGERYPNRPPSNRVGSSLSVLSNMTWTPEKETADTCLQLDVDVRFKIPDITIEPALDVAQSAINDVGNAILSSCSSITWLGRNGQESFYTEIAENEYVSHLMTELNSVVEDLEPVCGKHLFHFCYYNFLWKDDMHGNFSEFINADPGEFALKREVERYLYIEKKVLSIPNTLPVGPICLHTDPIKDALHGFAMAWKTKFASVLHEEAKKKLDSALLYRSNVRNRLELHVQSLDQLNSSLHLLEELRDMENKIDSIYLPIELMYAKLREFELRLPRQEVEEVDLLREKWQELAELADQVREVLLKERRGAFEQELDKQVKTFVVEVIQFRNSFDAQGPAVPGIPPGEAVARLHDFQHRYKIYDAKRKTLDSVSKLFGIVCKPFPELDKTGEELDLLSQLYGLFQKFIRFDQIFRDTLWAEVDLDSSSNEVEGYWDECLALPSKLKDWDAYGDLKTKLQTYLEVFPLLNSLAAKEIRNRHWLKVMQVTGSSFQLEANVFKLCHLLDIGLIKHKQEIEEICRGASRELELEIKMRMTEEEWTEQVLTFEHYKKRGPVYLEKVSTERLLEQLDDAQALLANMLTSRYIGPLRDEAASWAEKLKEVAEVLELWLEVQDLWQYLEAVFSNPIAAKELPQEAKRYARIDKGWTKMMKRAFDTRNVLQCCYGGEVPKAVVLRHIHEELEICFKSLVGYLDNKRRTFPRFYFVSDPILLAMLSRPNDLESVRPYLKSIFASIHDVKLEKNIDLRAAEGGEDTQGSHASLHRTGAKTPHERARTSSALSQMTRGDTPPKIDKRLTQIYEEDGDTEGVKIQRRRKSKRKDTNNSAAVQNFRGQSSKESRELAISRYSLSSNTQHVQTYLPSELTGEDTIIMEAVSVYSNDGEMLNLNERVTLFDGVEVWLQKLKDTVSRTIKDLNMSVIQDCINGIPTEEWASKYPAQVCRLGMLYQWTKECEMGIAEIKFERKALQGTLKKYIAANTRLPAVLAKGSWKNIDEPMLPLHKSRLESMIAQSLYLRDILENMCNRKLRETTDFEWRRSIRCYYHSLASEEKPEPLIWILDTPYLYGNEFFGTNPGVCLTPLTERCFLTMSLAMNNMQGSAICGPVGVGKTETVKGLANILGYFMGCYQCCTGSDPNSIGKVAQGVAMDGCWGCYDEAHKLQKESLSVLVDHAQSIYSALKSKQSYCTLSDGQEVNLNKSMAMFMTINIEDSAPSGVLPNDVKAVFRTVALIKPDIGQILKAKCSALGFRAPGILSNRLKVLTELIRDQLSTEFHHQFTLSTLSSVLKRASQKRRYMKDEKSQDKYEKREEASRSESQASEAASRPQMASQQSVAIMAQNNPKLVTGYNQRKAGIPNPMTAAGKMEHAIVYQTIEEIIGPRLKAENIPLFKSILKDVFSNLPEPPLTMYAMSARTRGNDFETALENKAQESGLVAHKPWINKCMQLYHISQVYNGVIVAGPPGCGKSTCIQTLVDALSLSDRGVSRQSQGSRSCTVPESVHKLLKINPLVVDDTAIMFGYLTPNHDWVDGIVTSACRKANRNLSTTWLCLDGPLNEEWADNFNSILDGDKVLHLKNGDKLALSDSVMLLFETDNLSSASPSTVARSGIVYLDKDVVGWRPIAKAWLENRTSQEVHIAEKVLQRAFQKTLDPVSHFVVSEAKPRIKLSEVGLFKTCLGLLSAMLADNIEIGGELHIERLYIFCLIWTYGGLLDATDRKAFSDLLKTLSSALPDDDRDICVFDYYVDESGEWDPWHSRVPEAVYADNQGILGEVFVDTTDTVRTRILMELANASGQNVLLVGPPGSGKTTLINEFFDVQDLQLSICKKLVFSGSSTAKQLQQFVETNIYHRQGFVYGAKDNKKLKVFIDDVNLPVADEFGVMRCNELLRQLLDDKVVCTLQKPFEWKTVEGLTVMSALSLSEYPGVEKHLLSDRLLRHFAVFNLPAPQDEPLKLVVNGILEANMTDQDRPGLDLDLHNGIVAASCEILSAVQSVLRPTPMPGRTHYLFTLKDITKCFQCLKKLADESKADDNTVISLWKHEMQRIIRDRISRASDLNWFDETLSSILSEKFPNIEGALQEHFVTFYTDARMTYQRPVTSVGYKHRTILQPVDSLKDLHSCLNTHLTRYNEEFGNTRLDIMLSDYTINHIVRMHRVLSFHHGGNLMVIGAVGSHLATLCKLALHVADIPIHKVDTSKESNFFDGLRSAIRLSGTEGKLLTLVFTARDLQNTVYLDAINSLLISGEYPHLFSNDELDGLLQAIGPTMKRELSTATIDPMKFFVSRVQSNLHIILCLNPNHELLWTASSRYPGLLSGCEINWMCDWPQESLLGEATYFTTRYQLTEEFEDLCENVTTCLANIHSFVLRDCRQMSWAGDVSPEINLNTIKIQDKKRESFKIQPTKVPNLPYSKILLNERIKLRHKDTSVPAKNDVYIGPTTFRRFMDCFKYLYNTKAKERTEDVEQLKKVLATLDQTRNDAKVMRKAIKNITGKYEDAKVNTSDLLKKLTAKATLLEKLKAKVGLSKSLDAYLHLNELEIDEDEEDELLKEEEYDDYDVEFDKMREATLKTRQVQAKEELSQAEKNVVECRKNLAYAREQVVHWKSKVDRSCVERLRGFQNPPVLVGQVMEMIMTLIGKRLPSQRLHEHREHYPKDDVSSRLSSSSSSTRFTVKKTKTKDGERFDRNQWKSMQITMNDAVKFVDMLHNVPWEDGLSADVARAVESYLSVGKDGQLGGVTGEGSLLENAQDSTWRAQKRTPSPEGSKGITIAASKYSSEDCATLVQYTIAIVEYTRLCGPLKASIERLHELEREIEENERLQREREDEIKQNESKDEEKKKKWKAEPEKEIERPPSTDPEDDLSEADLPRIQDEVNDLQKQFDLSVVQKHSLEMELQSMNERLKAATEMVDRLKPQEVAWRTHVKENDCNELLLANCITASAFLTYCGPANIDTRQRMGEFFMQVCEHHGLPLSKKLLFRNMQLIEFLYSKIDVMNLEILELPLTRLMLENACFIMQGESRTAWPLICDPPSRVISWLRYWLKDKNLVEVKYHELRSQLENCLSDGSPLLVTDCSVEDLKNDKRFKDTIQSCSRFINGKSRFKVIVEDHEVECDPKFRLYLHASNEPHLVPYTLAAYTSVLFYQHCREGVEEELLDRFMAKEKSRLDDERTALRQERMENMHLLDKLEHQMKNNLSSDVRLMNDLQATRKLADLKKQHEETEESQQRVEVNENAILKARGGYRSIAQRAAVCFDVSQYVRELNMMYQISFDGFLSLFDAAIAHSERSAVKALLDKLTYSVFTTVAKGLLERDRLIYALLMSIEVEESVGHLGPGEREFLISPNFSSVVMSAIGHTQPPESKITQAKKPFDWMTDDQYHNLQVLATHFDWFQEMFDRMPRDGRETQWRNLCESDMPENVPLPDKMDEVFKPMQRLCVVRAVRSDRLMHASTIFVQTVLGKKYVGEVSVDLNMMLKQSSPTTPLVLLFSFESEIVLKTITDFANKKQSKLTTVNVTENSAAAEKSAKKVIQKVLAEGQWVVLHNAHNSPRLLESLEAILAEAPQPDQQFRLWLSAQLKDSKLPTRLLQNSVKAVIDSPKLMKDSLVRSFTCMEPDILRQSSRPEWPAILHNLCYLHAAVQLRTKFGYAGWNAPMDFLKIGQNDLFEAINFATLEFKDTIYASGSDGMQVPRLTSWTGIRYMLSEVVYGSYITDFHDQASVSAMVDYWISPTSIKKDFEVARLKYKHPAAFFNPNVRLNTLIQALDSLPHNFLDVPEGCHIHTNIETLLGEDQYVFTRLNKVFDAMPSSDTLTHKLFPRPPSPFIGPPMSGISTQSNNPAIVNQGVFASASFATLKMRKDIELWEICHTMLQKVPKAYNKDYIIDRVKKIGGFTTFNNFIMKELDVMYKLLTEIRTTLAAIKTASEADVLGDQLSPHILSAADDLYHLRIPSSWCQMSGSSAPPLTWGLGQWLTELQNRCHHFEKILVLGREKMPAYWLGAFFNPRGLLALVKQDCMRQYSNDRSGNFEQFVFQTEVTSRDKDHLRDPPQEGMFVYGLYVWGCAWEKTTGELQDAPPRTPYATLPVVHLTCWPVNEKPLIVDNARASEVYQCPVYHSRITTRETIMEMDVRREGISATRWALRGLSATVRPY